MLVADVKARMSVSEFMGWIEYLSKSNEEKDDGNLLSGDMGSMISALTGE